MAFNCNACNREIEGTGTGFVAAMPDQYKALPKSSISGLLCPECSALIFKGKDSRSISVRWVKLSGAPDVEQAT